MKNWKIIGIIATLVIILCIPAYLLKEKHFRHLPEPRPQATFVGSKKCVDCHKAE
jgi:hypothetical protein